MILLIFEFAIVYADYAPDIQLLTSSSNGKQYRTGWVNMVAFNNTMLDVQPAEVTYVKNKYECGTRCIISSVCQSLNLILVAGANYSCQILKTDKYRNYALFKRRLAAVHYAVQSACSRPNACPHDGYICIPDYSNRIHKCECKKGYVGKGCKKRFCGEIDNGMVNVTIGENKPFEAFCEQGWLTIMTKTLHGSVDFKRKWIEYKNGFGNLEGEFWIGNDNLHFLTRKPVSLIIESENNERHYFSEYKTFMVGDEGSKYRLTLADYIRGNMKDYSTYHSGMMFSTVDQDNDQLALGNCAEASDGGWWYGDGISFWSRSCFGIGPYTHTKIKVRINYQ